MQLGTALNSTAESSKIALVMLERSILWYWIRPVGWFGMSKGIGKSSSWESARRMVGWTPEEKTVKKKMKSWEHAPEPI